MPQGRRAKKLVGGVGARHGLLGTNILSTHNAPCTFAPEPPRWLDGIEDLFDAIPRTRVCLGIHATPLRRWAAMPQGRRAKKLVGGVGARHGVLGTKGLATHGAHCTFAPEPPRWLDGIEDLFDVSLEHEYAEALMHERRSEDGRLCRKGAARRSW